MKTETESFDCPVCGHSKCYSNDGPDLDGLDDGWLYMDWCCVCGAKGTDNYRVRFVDTDYEEE